MATLLYRLGLNAAKRPLAVIFSWLVMIAIAAAGFLTFGGTLVSTVDIPGTPTAQTTDRLQEEFPDAARGSGNVVFQTNDGTEFSTQQREAITAVLDDARDVEGVADVVDPFTTDAELAEQQQELIDGRAELEAAGEQLESAPQQLDAAEEELDAAEAELQAAQEQLDAGKQQAIGAGMPEAAVEQQFADQQAQLDAALAEIETGRDQVEQERADYEEGVTEYEEGQELIELGERLLAATNDYSVVSDDGSAAIGTVQFVDQDMEVSTDIRQDVVATFTEASIDGVEILPSQELSMAVPEVLGWAEVVGLVIAGIVLVIMLGTLITAGLPLLNALVGVGVGALAALAFSSVVEMNSVTPVLGVMLGLAVGIDYALFIVHRHRTQLKSGMALRHSIAMANGTSGNAVVFAGSTVVIALLALNLTGIPFLGLMGTVGGFVVVIAVLVAITLTPAMLSLLGVRALSKRERRAVATHDKQVAERRPLKPMSTARAVLTAIGTIAVLAIVAIPVFSMRLGIPDGSSEAPDTTEYQAYAAQSEHFGAGRNAPIVAVADIPADLSEQDLLTTTAQQAEEIAELDQVQHVVPVGENEAGDMLMFQIIPVHDANHEQTVNLVYELRGLEPAGEVTQLALAGHATGVIDVSDALAEVLPLYLGVVVGLSLLIMILVFRSLVVPLIASGGFVLSVGAAMGAVVAIYQWGWLGDIFMVHSPSPVLSFLPTIMIGVLFGLAMDYQLFISSGMREAFAHGTEARLAVQQGFMQGRSVVAAAAIIMVSVFGGFIYADDPYIRPIGFGLAIGVLFDAFLVRMLMVPALMHLLGKSAWYLPKWLDRILPNVDVEGAKLAEFNDGDQRGTHAEQATTGAPVPTTGRTV
ncbi:MAG TPA: MMPL family transporter [Enteractinococcus helveticum]|uniref:MMPL family transporter n=1 Tax=Enteractinococcus helveticum TaxID=1837282 RepID=A0A921FNY5_9MICC|nr:MMPL family transporter [Enteractinococcus helveticum]HJF15433.1 MMPL family transporter [Enteractinococcus helveticum]